MDHQREGLRSSQKVSRSPYFVLTVVVIVSVMGAAVVMVGWWKGFNVYTLVFISSILVASVVMSSKHTHDDVGNTFTDVPLSHRTEEPPRGIPPCAAVVWTLPELSFPGAIEEAYRNDRNGPGSPSQNVTTGNSGSSDLFSTGSIRRWPAALKSNEKVSFIRAGSLPSRVECDGFQVTLHSTDANRSWERVRHDVEWNEDPCTLDCSEVADSFILRLPTTCTTQGVGGSSGGTLGVDYTTGLQYSNRDLHMGDVFRKMSNRSPFSDVDSKPTKPSSRQSYIQSTVTSMFQTQQVYNFVSSSEQMPSTQSPQRSTEDSAKSCNAEDFPEFKSSISLENVTEVAPSFQTAHYVEDASPKINIAKGVLEECL